MSNRKNIRQLLLKRNLFLLIIPIFIITIIILSLFFYFSYNKNVHYYSLLTELISKDFSFNNIDSVLKNNSNYLKKSSIIYINSITGSYTVIAKLGKYSIDLKNIYINKKNGYIRKSRYMVFYQNLSFSNFVLLVVPYATFFFTSQLLFFFTIISLLLIFIGYLLYNYFDYNKFKSIFLNLYFSLKEISDGNFNNKLKLTNIEEFDIIIEKINILQKDLKEKRIFYTENIEFLKSIVKKVSVPVLFFNHNFKIIDFNNLAITFLLNLFTFKDEKNIKELNFINFIKKLAEKEKLTFDDKKIEKLLNNNQFLKHKEIHEIIEKLKLIIIESNDIFAVTLNTNISKAFSKFLSIVEKSLSLNCNNIFSIEEDDYIKCVKELFFDLQNYNSIEKKYSFYKNSIDYISNMSHELRAPLNTIIGFSNIILQGIEGEIPEELKNDLNFIYNASVKLLMLIDEIIYITRLERFKFYKKENNLSVEFFIDLIKSFFIGFSRNSKSKLDTYIEENISFIYDFENLSFIFFNLFYYFFKLPKNKILYLNVFKFNSSLYFLLSNNNIKDKNHYFDLEMNYKENLLNDLINSDYNIQQVKKLADFLGCEFKWIKIDDDEYFAIKTYLNKV